jgi:hypothetical protein
LNPRQGSLYPHGEAGINEAHAERVEHATALVKRVDASAVMLFLPQHIPERAREMRLRVDRLEVRLLEVCPRAMAPAERALDTVHEASSLWACSEQHGVLVAVSDPEANEPRRSPMGEEDASGEPQSGGAGSEDAPTLQAHPHVKADR